VNVELKIAMEHDLLNQVAYHLSDMTCFRLRHGRTMEQMAHAAGITSERWFAIIGRREEPSLLEIACMAFALDAQVRIAIPEPDDEIPF
jgi:hypothetical protein